MKTSHLLAALIALLIVAAVAVYTLLPHNAQSTATTVSAPQSTSIATTTRMSPAKPVERSPNRAEMLVIALGDWGPPSPYLFYPRGPGYVLTSFVFDTLVWKDAHGIIPWLAASWQHPNATTWVFKLRRGVYWQDGVPLTARDVVFTFRYVARHGWTWRNITGIIAGVYAPDNYTVVVRLRRPYPFFLEDIASTLFILPEHVWRNVTNPYSYRSPKAFIGSGPYRLLEYKPGRYYLFEANERYWLGKPIYKYVKVVATGFSNPQAEAEAIKEGRIDTAVFMGKAYRIVRMLEKSMGGEVRVLRGPMYLVLYLGFNLDKWPYNETLFRRAIAYSLNLTELIVRVFGDTSAALPGSPGYIPPYSSFYNPNIPRYEYNPAKAAELLDKLGLRDVNGDGCRELPGGKPWRPLLVAPAWFMQEALVVRDMLRRVGVCVRIKLFKSFKQLDSVVERGAYDMEINGHGAVGNVPTAFSWYFSTPSFGTPWRNKTYEEIVEHILYARSREEAIRYAKKAQLVIAEELPRIALYYPYVYVVTRKDVRVHWFFTSGGIDGGIPLPYNKLALIARGGAG